MTESERKLKDLILTIEAERLDIEADSDTLKTRKKDLKRLEKQFRDLALQEFDK